MKRQSKVVKGVGGVFSNEWSGYLIKRKLFGKVGVGRRTWAEERNQGKVWKYFKKVNVKMQPRLYANAGRDIIVIKQTKEKRLRRRVHNIK